jgi:type IV pilus biogenesis protein CpaD/CtpE
MRARQFRGVLVLAIAASALGCVRPGQAGGGSPAAQEATARITNNNWLDVTVYASREGSRRRLGTVTGQNTRVFRLPAQMMDARGLRLLIDPIGSPQSYETELIPVGPGQQVELVVAQRIAMSHYSVFDP